MLFYEMCLKNWFATESLQSVKWPSPRSETDFLLLYQTKLINIINGYNLWEQVRQPVLRIVFSKDD